jgi:hypothetical protein
MARFDVLPEWAIMFAVETADRGLFMPCNEIDVLSNACDVWDWPESVLRTFSVASSELE